MGRISDLEMLISDLRTAAATINEAIRTLTEMFSGKAAEADSPPVEQEKPEPPLTLEQVRAVLSVKSQEGKTDKVRQLIEKFGATKLSGVNPKDYKALMKESEEL